MVPETAYPRVDSLLNIPDVARQLPRGVVLRWSAQPDQRRGAAGTASSTRWTTKPIITGSNLVDAQAQIDPLTNGPIVTFELDRAGGRKFGDETGQARGRLHGDPARRPGAGPATGHPEPDRPQRADHPLADEPSRRRRTSRSRSRPARCRFRSRSWRSGRSAPSLGEDSIRYGHHSPGIIGTLLVMLIMIGVLPLAGVLAVVGPGALRPALPSAALAMLDATLTLPGLAGIVLSIGIAVDANVLIFERIREELAAGKTVRLAVDEGFRHAMNAIVDSNVYDSSSPRSSSSSSAPARSRGSPSRSSSASSPRWSPRSSSPGPSSWSGWTATPAMATLSI